MIYDFCVIGGGIVGLATAVELLRRQPGASLVLLEKEDRLAAHQTSHNSGVIHAGIYYAPGSFKAKLCRRGADATKKFCETHDIPFLTCGKLLVATDAPEVERMNALHARAIANGVEVELLDAGQLRRREPNVAGLAAIFVPSTAIVDYRRVCEALAGEIGTGGGEILLGAEVDGILEHRDGVSVSLGERRLEVRHLVACAGLQSDRLARLAGLRTDFQIVPFRGEYFRLNQRCADIVHSLIYPIPDPALPFLGVHLTRMIDGSVTVGPNAVLGFDREGYRRFSWNAADIADTLRFPGFWRLVLQNFSPAMRELRSSLSKRNYLALCQKYCPSLALDDLEPMEPGIRAQAVKSDGSLVHDFLFMETAHMVHVCNAPSPAATSAMPIGEIIADKCLARSSSRSRLEDKPCEPRLPR
jgi:L-2-hydroxyglutarate oxidase